MPPTYRADAVPLGADFAQPLVDVDEFLQEVLQLGTELLEILLLVGRDDALSQPFDVFLVLQQKLVDGILPLELDFLALQQQYGLVARLVLLLERHIRVTVFQIVLAESSFLRSAVLALAAFQPAVLLRRGLESHRR